MLDIRTFDARQGGNVLYKALAHPLAAEAIAALYARLAAAGRSWCSTPRLIAPLMVMHPGAPAFGACMSRTFWRWPAAGGIPRGR